MILSTTKAQKECKVRLRENETYRITVKYDQINTDDNTANTSGTVKVRKLELKTLHSFYVNSEGAEEKVWKGQFEFKEAGTYIIRVENYGGSESNDVWVELYDTKDDRDARTNDLLYDGDYSEHWNAYNLPEEREVTIDSDNVVGYLQVCPWGNEGKIGDSDYNVKLSVCRYE